MFLFLPEAVCEGSIDNFSAELGLLEVELEFSGSTLKGRVPHASKFDAANFRSLPKFNETFAD